MLEDFASSSRTICETVVYFAPCPRQAYRRGNEAASICHPIVLYSPKAGYRQQAQDCCGRQQQQEQGIFECIENNFLPPLRGAKPSLACLSLGSESSLRTQRLPRGKEVDYFGRGNLLILRRTGVGSRNLVWYFINSHSSKHLIISGLYRCVPISTRIGSRSRRHTRRTPVKPWRWSRLPENVFSKENAV